MPAMDYSKIAELYDLYVQTEMDVPFFIQEAQNCHKVLELTAGTGRLSLPLLQAGIPLTCLDSSPEMLSILRRKLRDKGLSMPLYEMDMCHFSIPAKFDLIIIPFNAFAEVTQPALQEKALVLIQSHLVEGGHLICTLHNPAVRLGTCDGQVHWRGSYPLPDQAGNLFLSSLEDYEPGSHLVKGFQFYELYNADGMMRSRRFVEIEFYVHTRESFEKLARSQGYIVKALYGDYDRKDFQAEKSPFMIWVLGRG
jgi:ubiquinone/menaquinone biosynthesis C-methylase UbiE